MARTQQHLTDIDIGRCGVSANETTLHPNNNFKKVNHYRSMYGLQHGALVHTEQQAIKGPKITSVKPFKLENQRSNLYKKKKRETRNTYRLHKQTTTTVHQTPDLGQVQTFAAGLNVLMDPNLLPLSETIA